MEEYIVSARKYRPANFDSVVGQSALTTTLKNAVKSGKLAHAYLFCGPRGVGKTTCARIFAKAINCQHPTPDGEACNECESCQSFNEQRSLNIFELDAASNNSVEHIKKIMEQTRIPPQLGRYKVFIIDEVHMLSQAAFNAFLKTLEEPPSYVIFILATTEKQKILPTILSRCQIYDFERMTVADTIAHLKGVADKEGIKYEEEALTVIAEKADGGMRDALSIFDQAASFCQGDITYAKVIEDLNVLDSDYYFQIVDLSIANKVSDIMLLLNGIISKGFDPGQCVAGLARHIRNVLMAKDPVTLPLLETSEGNRQKYQQQAVTAPIPFLYKALRLLNQCDVNYRTSGNKRLLVELTLIEVAQITQADDATPVAGRKPRRLKSLFHNLIGQSRPKTAAKQVAAAVTPSANRSAGVSPATATPATNGDTGVSPTAPSSKYDPNNRPVLKSTTPGGTPEIGLSWKNVREMARRKKNKISLIPGMLAPTDPNMKNIATDNQFTQQDLELQWMSMCNRMPQKFSGIATRMKNMNPTILEFPHLEVVVENQIQLDQMSVIKGSIVNTLKLYLQNNAITLDMRLAERQEQVKILTRREQFEEMSKQNPAIDRLRDLLDLELA